MKKLITSVLVLVVLFSLTACTSSPEADETTTEEASAVPVVSLVCEDTAVKAGDTVELRVNIKHSLLTACFDIYVIADDGFIYEDNETSAGSMIMIANNEEKDGVERFAIRGIVAETYDLPDNDVCTIKYKVSEDSVPGDVINVILQVPAYQLGLDESGNDVYSVNEDVVLNNITFTVE